MLLPESREEESGTRGLPVAPHPPPPAVYGKKMDLPGSASLHPQPVMPPSLGICIRVLRLAPGVYVLPALLSEWHLMGFSLSAAFPLLSGSCSPPC